MKRFLILLPAIVILIVGCGKDDSDSSNSTTNLDGFWDNGEIVVHIQGTEGKFYEIKQGNWKRVWEQGFISIGSLKFSNISPLKADEFFEGQELWYQGENLIIQETGWSTTGEFNLRNNGNTLYVNTINPFGSNWSNVEYTRVYR